MMSIVYNLLFWFRLGKGVLILIWENNDHKYNIIKN